MWQAVIKAIENNERFLLSTHRDPDADGIGSELALRRILEDRGKEAVILNPDSLPGILGFMDRENAVIGFDSLGLDESRRLLDRSGVIFLLDAGNWKRFFPMHDELVARAGKVLFIDHHPPEEGLTTGSVVRDKASSTAELVYELVRELGHPLDEYTAFQLYCAIAKDTGSFRFENTSSKVFEIAAELTSYGVLPHEVYDQLFERTSVKSVHCLSRVLGSLRLAYDNRLAYISVTMDDLEETDTAIEETDNFVNVIRSIDPVQACIYFRESDNCKVKVSFRSKSRDIDINKLAAKFGGGGHKRAAGALISGPLEEVIERVVAEAAEFFE